MRHSVCNGCTKRELHCKSWCKDWSEEEEKAEKERKMMQKRKQLMGDLAEMGKQRDRRFRK